MDSLTRILNAPARTRRIAAIGLLAAALGLAGLTAYAAVSSVQSARQAVREQRETLGRLKAVLALKPMMEKSAQATLSAKDRPEFLTGASDSVIQADLQTWLDGVARQNGVRIMSVGNAPSLQQGGMRFAGLRADISGTNSGIQGTIFAIETAKPYLIIRQAQINTTLEGQQIGFDGDPELVLRVQFYGALPPAAAAAAAAPTPASGPAPSAAAPDAGATQ
jgi:hypothetical protein